MSCTHENKEICNLGARKSKLARFVDKVNRARKITSKETTFSIYLKLSTGPGLLLLLHKMRNVSENTGVTVTLCEMQQQ